MMAMHPQTSVSERTRALWRRHGDALLGAAVIVMTVLAVLWLGYEVYRLYWQPKTLFGVAIHRGAIDLKILNSTVIGWFDGATHIDNVAIHYVYPPASYPMFAPLLGWRSLPPAFIAWTIAALIAIGAWMHRMVHDSGAQTSRERAFIALLPLATYPTGAVIGNGQVTLFVIAALLAGLHLLHTREPGWKRDLAASLLILFALTKPSVAAPFFLIALFSHGGLRVAVFVCVAYAALTLYAASFRPASLVEVIRQFLTSASEAAVQYGEANIHILLADLGLAAWAAPASLAIIAVLAWWIWRHRHVDLWLLIGVTAIVARFWTYHRWYDDVLIVLPVLALFRYAKRGDAEDSLDVVAGALAGVTLLFLLAPGGLYLLPAPWNRIYVDVQVLIWLSDLVFLMIVAARARRADVPLSRPASA
jgi:hypothetical protein